MCWCRDLYTAKTAWDFLPSIQPVTDLLMPSVKVVLREVVLYCHTYYVCKGYKNSFEELFTHLSSTPIKITRNGYVDPYVDRVLYCPG